MAGGRRPGLSGPHPADIEDGTFARAASPRPGLLGAHPPAPAPGGASPAGAVYEEDVHDDLTEVLALAAGFGISEAREIAAENQETDTNLETSPMPYWTRNRWGVPYYSVGAERRRLWHFTTEARRAELRRQYRQSGSLRDLGRYMHVLQDSYSHAGLNPVVGQIGTSVNPQTGAPVYNSPNPLDQAPWHEADDPSKNPHKAMTMARHSYDELVEAREYLAEHGRLGAQHEAVGYDRIRGLVEEFCREPDKGKRLSIANQLGSVVLQARRRQEDEDAAELRSRFEETERRRTRTIQPPRRRGQTRRRN